MEDQDARNLIHTASGRGYAARVFPALRSWLGNPPARVVDVVVTLIFGVPTAATAVASGIDQGRTAAGVAVGLATSLPLLVRRRWPFAVLAVIVVASVLAPVDVPFPLPLSVALYTIGANRSWEATIAAATAVVATAVLYASTVGGDIGSGEVVGVALERLEPVHGLARLQVVHPEAMVGNTVANATVAIHRFFLLRCDSTCMPWGRDLSGGQDSALTLLPFLRVGSST